MVARSVPSRFPIEFDQTLLAGAPERAAGTPARRCNQVILAPMFVPELAARLGYTADYLRRHIDRLVIEQRMPPSLPALGWKRWDRASIEAWLAGRAMPQAANDAAPTGADDDAWRAALAGEYGTA